MIDLAGTFAFAVNGALTATRAVRLDIVGVLGLGLTTAIGGGIMRDVLIGAVPPSAFTQWYYLAAAGSGATVAFFVSRPSRLVTVPMIVLDAIGLSLFCVTGAQKAMDFGLDPAAAIIVGAITAVGGGTIRDVLIGQVPSVLTSGLYAIPALIGAAITVLAVGGPVLGIPIAVVAAAVCFVIRMLGVWFKLEAPKVGWPERGASGG
ncbi:MAG: trimeric intracellular cation channel family protein [Micropruina sp.]|nr:trimeric intracellular cation channel family protein [Micropruina sp.]